MSDLFGIGASGVAAYQTALSVVGDNVANADTPGYVRRKVTLASAPVGGAARPTDRDLGAGGGVRIRSIDRAYDALKATAARDADSDLARVATRADWLARLQTGLGGGDASLGARLGGFFDAAQDLSSSPASPAARTIFLDRADQTAAAFRATAAHLDTLAADIATATGDAVGAVNRLTTTLAGINTALRRSGGASANALLDARDKALADLATFVRIGVTDTGRGTVEVRVDGPGAARLVDAAGATRIGVSGGDLVLNPTHDPQPVRLPASGSLSGLVEAGRRVAAVVVDVDALADRFAAAANAQHSTGVDAQGNDGSALFATTTLTVAAGRANGGDATVDVALAAAASIAASGYVVGFDGTAWTLARGDGSASVTGTGPLTLDGVTMTTAGTAHAGDRFDLAPRAGAAGIALRALAPAQVAAASRWLTAAGGANTGTGRMSVATDPTAAALPVLPAYRVVVTATGADVIDPATGTPLAAIAIGATVGGAGFSFILGGAPAVGDRFDIVRNTDGIGDNGNVRALVALRDAGGPTIEASLDATVTGIASTLAETKALALSASAVRDDAARASDAASGIDLDQEAAELTRLQAAYRANAQVIAAARDLFDSLLAAVN